ncbi:MAG: hypothetical protein ACOCXX_01315 [Planctomycetota bacterium]
MPDHYTIFEDATVADFGTLDTDAPRYRPLDTVTVRIGGRTSGDTRCTLRVADPEQQTYLEREVDLEDNRATVTFTAGGTLGNHYVYLQWPDREVHSRYVNFTLEAESSIESGDEDFDTLLPFTRDQMCRGRRDYDTPRGRFVGYVSADTIHFDGIWLRDWIYQEQAYRHWERAMQCGLDRFLEHQDEKGMVPDGIERDGRTWRIGLESDVEYILVLGAWRTWQATGNDAWMARVLPKLERALDYVMNDPKHWDDTYRLVKRQHSCDTWDYDIDGAGDKGEGRFVIATCDQSGYVLAMNALAAMHRHLGHDQRAGHWQAEAEAYRGRAVELLWDGTKFLHHVHLDEIDHGDFDESDQLAMGNTWATTRRLADAEQSRSIVDEYHRRLDETGDAFPWWSLQPGYPNHLGYWTTHYRLQGGYANGGLMPWVGGELCRGAFTCGREAWGVTLLRDWAEHLRRTGGAHVWYWPDGTPGFRTRNEVNYAGWGMAQWTEALVAGLAGMVDNTSQWRTVSLSPRWSAAEVDTVRATARYAASTGYVAYRLTIDREETTLELELTGSGESAQVALLLPAGWSTRSVTVDGADVEHELRHEDNSAYACFEVKLGMGVHTVRVICRMNPKG